LVVSIGSGTAMVSVKNKRCKHIGGTAIGARTLLGFSKLLIKTDDLSKIESLAKKGNPRKTDITLGSIYPKGIGLLPPSATAASFGNIDNPKKEDIALGLINMIAQNIGTLSVFAAKAHNHKSIILIGKIPELKSFKKIIVSRINVLSDIPVTIPENAGFATAIGAAISIK
jgi:pantothenate kinase